MRNSQRHFTVPVFLLVLSFVLLANLVLCRQVPYSPEVELADPSKPTTNARVMNMRRLHTVRPAPMGYPPPPTVAEPPSASPAPSPSA